MRIALKSDRIFEHGIQIHPIQMINRVTTPAIALVIFTLCQAAPSFAAKPAHSVVAIGQGNMPLTGKVVKLTQGDLMCYVDLIDVRGKKHNIGADFAICERTEFLNKQVNLTYKRIRVNDCNSNEPCGKTRLKNAIVKMKLVKRG